ncbi:tight junction protein 1-like [Pyxicephalus adspersus]|uniref:tight junction protein 1-like n=1 Tax=Pyxicephalus adspersus TaxID=30357 RepID=UPI003B5CCFF8
MTLFFHSSVTFALPSHRFLGSYTSYDYLKRNIKWGKPADTDPPDRTVNEKRFDPVPQVTSTSQYNQASPVLVNHAAHAKHQNTEVNPVSLELTNSTVTKPEPPPPQTKPTVFRPSNREDTVQSNFFPQKSFPDKAPVNGTEQTGKTITPSYNRFTPKPYTSSARPFERKFESPKFNHNLLTNEAQGKPELPAKPQNSPQPILKSTNVAISPEMDGTSKPTDIKSKYQPNNVNAVPKAVPVSPSALEDDDEDDAHTVVATARGIFNSNGGVLSSIETGVSIIIPQGAIPDGVEQEIYFKVCRDNSILPPLDKEKGETLLSPLVMCGPHGLKFLKPVELRLPHCASMTPDGWSFALKSSDTSSGTLFPSVLLGRLVALAYIA